jgi:hypothetical protein
LATALHKTLITLCFKAVEHIISQIILSSVATGDADERIATQE